MPHRKPRWIRAGVGRLKAYARVVLELGSAVCYSCPRIVSAHRGSWSEMARDSPGERWPKASRLERHQFVAIDAAQSALLVPRRV